MRRKKLLKLFLSILILLIVVIIVAINRYNNMTKFNSDFINGNTGGNLQNGGYFCEYDGMVYFRNPNDNNSLYCMDRNGNHIKKLSSDTASFINVDDHYVYYTRNNAGKDGDFSFVNIQSYSLCRLTIANKKTLILDSDACLYASLIGNYVYYSHYDEETASTVYKVKIDGSERECVLKYPIIAVSSDGKNLYYCGTDSDAHIYCLNTANGSISKILETNCYMPIASDGFLYYINCDKGYYLEKMNLSTGEITTLVKERVECYNVYGSTVFYQNNDANNSGLYRLKHNGYEYVSEKIMSGNHLNINVTSTYVYFMKYGVDETIYRTPTVGAINVTVFSPDTEK